MALNTERLSPDATGLDRAAALLRAGQVVAIPTETVYGLAADATDAAAVARIYEAKGRPSFNPLIVHVPGLDAAREIATLDHAAAALAGAFWPGPLTLVLPLRDGHPIAALATAGLPTVAIRVPDHPVAQEVLRRTDRPLAAPSANASGRVSSTAADHVLSHLDGRIAAVLDAGPCPVGVESTIVATGDGTPRLLRPGGLPVEAAEACLNHPLIDGTTPGKIVAPGQLASHYAPGATLRLNATTPEPGEVFVTFGDGNSDWTLSATRDLFEAAANLFPLLHRLDREDIERAAFAPIPDHGLGRAINDRLRRAAAPRGD